jgi:hypothetical protein
MWAVQTPDRAAHARTLTLRELLSRLAASSALIVAVMYAVGRLLAELYYREFGLTATSAGLATTDLIGQAAGSTIWLVLLSAPGLILAFGIARDPRGERGVPDALQLAAFFGLICVPIAAVVTIGDPLRIGDWGIPVAAIGLGVVAISAVSVLRRPAGKASDVNERLKGLMQLSSALASFAESSRIGFPLRPVARLFHGYVKSIEFFARHILVFNLASYSIVAIGGIALGIAGVLQQADDVQAGSAEQPAPWSLAPAFSDVEVFSFNRSEIPVEKCLTEIGRSGDVWVFWDPDDDRVWRTNESLQLGDC